MLARSAQPDTEAGSEVEARARDAQDADAGNGAAGRGYFATVIDQLTLKLRVRIRPFGFGELDA